MTNETAPQPENTEATEAKEPEIDLSQAVNANVPYGDVMVFCEQIDGVIQPVALELLGAGRRLADKLQRPLSAILIGHQISELSKTLIAHGADQVFVADAPELYTYRTLPYRRVIVDLLESFEVAPHSMLLGSTTTGRDLAPRIASHFQTGLTADTTELDVGPYEHKGGSDPSKIGLYINCLYAIRPSFGESLKARILGPWKNPQMATARPGVQVPLEPDWNRQGQVININFNFKPEDFRMEVLETVRELTEGVSITDADVLVAGGAGLSGPDDFELLKELSDCFENASIAASRKVVDLGWIPYKYQVGQTGKTVRPKIYIACGISGAIQHRVGMQSSSLIIAINKDPDAPIFKFAHHGIVGDFHQVVPELIQQIKSRQPSKSQKREGSTVG